MSCRDLLNSMYGVETDDVFEAIRLVSDALAHGCVVAGSDGLSEERSDVSSPRDMVRLLEMLHRGELLSEPSTAAVMDILGRQQAATIIPYGLPPGTRTAHKTGGVTGVRCDVGIVFAPSGPYAVAIMAKQVTDTKGIDRALAGVSKAVYAELGIVSLSFASEQGVPSPLAGEGCQEEESMEQFRDELYGHLEAFSLPPERPKVPVTVRGHPRGAWVGDASTKVSARRPSGLLSTDETSTQPSYRRRPVSRGVRGLGGMRLRRSRHADSSGNSVRQPNARASKSMCHCPIRGLSAAFTGTVSILERLGVSPLRASGLVWDASTKVSARRPSGLLSPDETFAQPSYRRRPVSRGVRGLGGGCVYEGLGTTSCRRGGFEARPVPLPWDAARFSSPCAA